jgi:hypothetical protein
LPEAYTLGCSSAGAARKKVVPLSSDIVLKGLCFAL